MFFPLTEGHEWLRPKLKTHHLLPCQDDSSTSPYLASSHFVTWGSEECVFSLIDKAF